MVTVEEVRHELHLYTEQALAETKIKHFITKINSLFGTAITDNEAKILAVCYRIAMSLVWDSIERHDDVSYAEKKAETFKNLYLARCSDINVTPIGIDVSKVKMVKINWDHIDDTESKIV